MPSFERRQYAGGAPPAHLASDISSAVLSIPLDNGTGYPDGSIGPFHIVIDRGQSNEEHIYCASRSGTTITVASSGRGVAGTSAAAHTAGATVEHGAVDRDFDEANQHYANTGLDHHTQYLNNTRHDVTARHTFGAALGTPSAPPGTAAAAAAGSGASPARSDHTHNIGALSVVAGSFAAGAIVNADVSASAAVDRTKFQSAKVINAQRTTALTGLTSTTAADLTSLTGTVTTTGTRNFTCNAKVSFTLTGGSSGGVFLYLVRDGTVIDTAAVYIPVSSVTATAVIAGYEDDGVTAASHTWKLQYSVTAGATVDTVGSATWKAYLTVQDVT